MGFDRIDLVFVKRPAAL